MLIMFMAALFLKLTVIEDINEYYEEKNKRYRI